MAITRLSHACQWLAKAVRDLRSARLLTAGDDPLYDIALFHCQQAGEKAIKGYLFLRKIRFQKTHDLRELVNLDPDLSSLVSEARLLTPFALRTRYPAYGQEPGPAEYAAGFAAAERVYRFVLAKHPELEPEKRT